MRLNSKVRIKILIFAVRKDSYIHKILSRLHKDVRPPTNNPENIRDRLSNEQLILIILRNENINSPT